MDAVEKIGGFTHNGHEYEVKRLRDHDSGGWPCGWHVRVFQDGKLLPGDHRLPEHDDADDLDRLSRELAEVLENEVKEGRIGR